ncbi:hypothetical protein ERO13_D08G158550v2 [Gossypium hirsutum]|nr:hypothetical protein ERO13_D08G158550v2 [Gossypium hirsutum]
MLFSLFPFVVLCRTALGLHIPTSLKTLLLVCLKFCGRQISLINYEIVLKEKKEA